jgi:acetoacetyl-CoA synthetase
MTQPLWSPSAARIAEARLTRFIADLGEPGVSDYPSLYAWSIEDPESFWAAVWRFCGVVSGQKWDRVLEGGDRMPGARWFPGATLNFAENLLGAADLRPALVFRAESGERRELSRAELHREVARLAAGLRAAGVGIGDRVAGYLPNCTETVCAMLATASLGAVWSSCSPEFGAKGLLDRFGQIQPKVLFAVEGYRYNGHSVEVRERLREVLPRLSGLERLIIVPYADHGVTLPGAVSYAGFGDREERLHFARMPFEHPLYILYSSGTTGAPKCMVHGAGGTLLQHLKELCLHCDVGPEDRVFYFTTCGWMMWNWLVTALAADATVVLYDGSPFHPDPGVLWDLAAEERITVFGGGAKYFAALEKAGVTPGKTHDLSRLKAILSTGSPLLPQSYDYVYRDVKPDVQLSSISGGTDIISCFALGCPVLPVWQGEIQCRGLGMKVEVFDDSGRPVRGEQGELVCTAPFPSMPVSFWNDPDGKIYQRSYFERFPGIWAHGDYAELTEHDGIIIHGRSDAVLNPGGVRIGTAEIYRAVEILPEVLESLAVGQDWGGDVRVVLFVKTRPEVILDAALIGRIRSTIRAEASPRHVPAKIIPVPDIPRTLSGKIVELAVREVIHGRPVKNRDALANPEALEHFRDLPALAED